MIPIPLISCQKKDGKIKEKITISYEDTEEKQVEKEKIQAIIEEEYTVEDLETENKGKLEIAVTNNDNDNLNDKEVKKNDEPTSNQNQIPDSKPPQQVQEPAVEKIYTGKKVKENLINIGFNTVAQGQCYIDNEYGNEQIMTFIGSENVWDMIFTVNKIPTELIGKVQEACEIIIPGYGGALYDAILRGENETLTIANRRIILTTEWYGMDVKISAING